MFLASRAFGTATWLANARLDDRGRTVHVGNRPRWTITVERCRRMLTHAKEAKPGRKRLRIAVKVVDIFGNDTMTIIDVSLKR